MSIQRYTDPNIYEPELKKDPDGIWVLHDDHLEAMKELEEKLQFASSVARRLLIDLPSKRDWLDPSLEKELKALEQIGEL